MHVTRNSYSYTELEKYVGKTFCMDYNEVDILFLLGGVSGEPFFLCKWKWSDHVYCAPPLDVIVHFEDYEPIKDFQLPDK